MPQPRTIECRVHGISVETITGSAAKISSCSSACEPIREKRRNDCISDGKVGDAGADRIDDARAVRQGNAFIVGRDVPLYDEQVMEVERTTVHGHGDLAGPRRGGAHRARPASDCRDLQTSRRPKGNCAHQTVPLPASPAQTQQRRLNLPAWSLISRDQSP